MHLCSVPRRPRPISLSLSLSFNEWWLSQVLYTRGSLQLWKATYSAGKLVKSSNAASQDLDPTTRSVINKAEYLGDKLWVTASGTYTPLVGTKGTKALLLHCWLI